VIEDEEQVSFLEKQVSFEKETMVVENLKKSW
jgi:hypothetical protein